MKLKRSLSVLMAALMGLSVNLPAACTVYGAETVYYVGAEREYKTINDALDAVKAAAPSSSVSTSANSSRFVLYKLNSSWVQIDAVDCTQGFSGSSNSEHQRLNLTG